MNRRRFLIAGGGAAVVGAAAVLAPWDRIATDEAGAQPPAGDPGPATATAIVTRGDLATERDFNATVSFGDTRALTTTASGTITWRRARGEIVRFGETLIRIDDRPLLLVAGAVPLYRELRRIDTRGRDENGRRLELQDGLDVAQLQAYLLSAGFDADGVLEADAVFGTATETAVKAWQQDAGLAVSGRVDATQMVFANEPVRVAADLRVGDPFGSLEVTDAVAAVIVDTSNRDRGALAVGTSVSIDLPDAASVAGLVTNQEQTAAADGSRIWRTTIEPAGDLPADASTATVRVVDIVAADVVRVPTSALLALAEGGFAVELVDDDGGATLVRVDVGDVLDGLAEVSGGLTEGDVVVVPT